MKMKKMNQESSVTPRDEHELLQQEDMRWLADIQDALSPYWSARLEYDKGNRPIVAVDGLRFNKR